MGEKSRVQFSLQKKHNTSILTIPKIIMILGQVVDGTPNLITIVGKHALTCFLTSSCNLLRRSLGPFVRGIFMIGMDAVSPGCYTPGCVTAEVH